MRMKDKTQLIALNDLRIHARAVLIMADKYEKSYKDKNAEPQDTMDTLDEIWRIIGFNSGELVRKIAEENKP